MADSDITDDTSADYEQFEKALLVTIVTAGAGVALVAHFTGVILGAIAGRRRLLKAS